MTLRQRLRLLTRAKRYARKMAGNEIPLMRACLQPGDTAVEIGTHKGAATYWLAKFVGPAGAILSFDPIPMRAGHLRDYAELCEGHIEVFECALSHRSGSAKLQIPNWLLPAALQLNGSALRDPIDVTLRTLDDALEEAAPGRRVTFLKCDHDHHETIFLGAENLLSNDRPVLLFESGNMYAGRMVCRPVFDHLASFGYVGHYFDDNAVRPLPNMDSEDPHPGTDPGNQRFVFTHPSTTRWTSMNRPFQIERLF